MPQEIQISSQSRTNTLWQGPSFLVSEPSKHLEAPLLWGSPITLKTQREKVAKLFGNVLLILGPQIMQHLELCHPFENEQNHPAIYNWIMLVRNVFWNKVLSSNDWIIEISKMQFSRTNIHHIYIHIPHAVYWNSNAWVGPYEFVESALAISPNPLHTHAHLHSLLPAPSSKKQIFRNFRRLLEEKQGRKEPMYQWNLCSKLIG